MEGQIGQPMKRCSDCGSFKPHSEFTAARRSAQEVDVHVAEQKGLCAICREAPTEHVDHHHETGRVRGILASTAMAASASSGTGTTC